MISRIDCFATTFMVSEMVKYDITILQIDQLINHYVHMHMMIASFTNYELISRWTVPGGSGIYVISKRLTSGKYNVLYVGKADPFDERGIKTRHHARSCWKKYTNNPRIKTCKVTTESERTQLEKKLITKYNPPCNKLKP